tara:strand:- start:184 stop:393 length:210 start_codon:yes stop_codon:yes gene_type:complete
MEYLIDKYSHKLSVYNKISYEIARNIIEKNIEKLQNKFPHSDNIVKKSYQFSKKQSGGNNKYIFKINYS